MINVHISADTWQGAVKQLAEEWKEKISADKERRRVVEDDAFFSEWRKPTYYPGGQRSSGALLGRLGWYQNTSWKSGVPTYALVSGFVIDFGGDFGQPVVMRGSLYCLYRRYSNSNYGAAPNGWCSRVLRRYLKKIRYTCFEFDKHYENICRIALQVDSPLQKKHRVNWKPGQAGEYSVGKDNCCYINGKYYSFLTDHQFQYLKKLWRISKGLELLELKQCRVNLPR